jgi:hypothetical protein
LPAVTGSTESVFVIETSARGWIVVPCEALLFPGAGSLVVDVTDALFVIAPSTFGVMTTPTVAFAPAAIVPMLHVTVPAACEQLPADGVAETNETFAGSVSVIVTPWASDGPALLAVRVYETFEPRATGSAASVFVSERSADVLTVVPCVDELFAAFVSVVVVVTVAVFVSAVVRFALTVTVIVRLTLAPGARSPIDHDTVPAVFVPPFEAETNVVPAGTGSLIETLCAVDGPAFETFIV